MIMKKTMEITQTEAGLLIKIVTKQFKRTQFGSLTRKNAPDGLARVVGRMRRFAAEPSDVEEQSDLELNDKGQGHKLTKE